MNFRLAQFALSVGTIMALIGLSYARGQAIEASTVWQPYRDAGAGQPAIMEQSPVVWPSESGGAFPEEALIAPEAMATATCAPMTACLLDPHDPALWRWRILPSGVIWQSYWAGAKESRLSGTWFGGSDDALLDVTLGGRVSVLRYGTDGPGRPHGFELQMEGAGMPRLNLNHNWDLESADFRFGLPLVYGNDRWQTKFSYYHLSSHMGDEFAIRNGGGVALAKRINFSRDTLVLGGAFFPRPAWRIYGEVGWAFYADEQTDPWEFQVGVDVARPGPTGIAGTPFFAVNGHLRQEHNFGGNFVAQAGWLWRGESTHILRTGFHYFNGKSNQFEFANRFEQQIGGGLWYDY